MSQQERTVMFVYNTALQARLVGLGSFKGKEWPLSAGTFTIGRDASNDLVLDKEPGVSKTHCKITMENNQFVISDAESRNGTLVNGMAVKRALLQDQDEVRICNASFRFIAPGGAGIDRSATNRPTQAIAAPSADESTMRVARSAPAEEAPVEEKSPAVWPYFLAGMLVFFGLAGGTLYFLGFIPPELLGGTPTPTEALKEVPPPEPVKGGEEPKAEEPKTAAAEPPGTEEPKAEEPKAEEPKAEEPKEVANAPTEPSQGMIKPDADEFTGSVKFTEGGAGSSVVVKHAINGRVSAVSVKPGDSVKKGETLLTYEDVDLRRRLETAREQFRSLKEIAEAQDTDRAKKALAEARADVQRLESQLGSSKLVAPESGKVAKVHVSSGKRAGRGSAAVTLSSGGGGKATVVGIVPPSSGKKVRKGMKAVVIVGDDEFGAVVTDTFNVPAGAKTTLALERTPDGLEEDASVRFRLK